MLEPILQQIGSGNPALAQLISQNPAAFLQLLSEVTEGGGDASGLLAGLGEGSEGDQPGTMTIPVTAEEREAIERVSPPRSHFFTSIVIYGVSKADS